MPWFMHVLLALGPLVIIAVIFLAIHILTRITGIRGYAPGWQLRCTRCNHTRDAGDAGLIRIGAISAGKRLLGYCKNCHGLRWLAVERIVADA